MSKFSLPKSEILTNKKKFDLLFKEGKTLKGFPLRLVFIIEKKSTDHSNPQFAFSVPKRSFKKAVDRNYLKRRMKEAFRLNKHSIYDKYEGSEETIYGIFIYVNREKLTYKDIEKGMVKIMRLVKDL